jgi:ribosome-associated heat shock protein Hsp15
MKLKKIKDKIAYSLNHQKKILLYNYSYFIQKILKSYLVNFCYNLPMRIDKFLNAVNITKRRAVAEDMLEHKVVFINDLAVKKAKEVKVGDIIEIKYLEKSDKFKVLQIPTTKSTPKSKIDEYVQRID